LTLGFALAVGSTTLGLYSLASGAQIRRPDALPDAVPPAPFAGLKPGERWIDRYRTAASAIIGEALFESFGWHRLAEMTDRFGHRLSGSAALTNAIAWSVEEMRRDGLENVHTEPVMVPRWVRGEEHLEIVEPARHDVIMLGLGGSVGTPPAGIEAELLSVKSFDDLEAHGSQARGRIVLFNAPFTGYSESVQFRSNGAVRAARLGAVAALVRSVGPPGLRTPHTGALRYADDVVRIPAAAIATEDADRLQRLQDRGVRVTLRLEMSARTLADVESANVIAEIRGSERPHEIVVLSGHIDSWDVGTGASDDGAGCVVSWETLRILKKLNLRPRRTIRLVLFTNEENGLRGGIAYRDAHRSELANHVLMFESDSGVFGPYGFGFTGDSPGRAAVREIATLLNGIGLDYIGPNGGGADIGPSVQAARIPAMSLETDGAKYFVIHHTPADTVERIDPIEMSRAAAGIAVMAYIVADMPTRLGEIRTE
jgi:carboxypeptidase Q